VFPGTGIWWLERYEGLRRHLDGSYSRSFSDPETCVIFDLRGARCERASDHLRAGHPPQSL
jgi:hypothetical protein